ncbi:hypothetical protein LCGC14_0654640 [marine sediment metagenome]|uniref:Phosphotyrosine protein phosphatase I domain-containing protein n=1 Tax=marine sediment metagenome TaxID=412755 RepID=A0A0F9RF73_9ZZZZ|nr:hypothetical protein [Candidatus Aminicenantes bacterium]
MNKKISINNIKNLIFVCYGNTCRSPMAEGIAKKVLGSKFHVESAGISPSFNCAAEESIKVMQTLFEINISNHQPRKINNLSIERFDFVIALDLFVYDAIKMEYEISAEKLILWEIDDPYLQDVEVYKKCAEKIYQHISDYFV